MQPDRKQIKIITARAKGREVKVMKTKIKRIILFLIALLAITTLTGCPQTIPPPGKIYSAKEAWEIIKSAQETLPEDAVPVYINGIGYYKNRSIKNGMAYDWEIGFYSESERKVWEVGYYSFKAESGVSSKPTSAEERYADVSLTAYDLTDWNIDSTEACKIAVQNGAGEVTQIRLYTARLNVLDSKQNLYKIPEFIPESNKLYWAICAGDIYYIDACTGEYLGSCTVMQLDSM